MLTLAWLLAACAALPLIIVAAECLAGGDTTTSGATGQVPPFAVLIPAHDEAAGLGEVIAAAKRQLRACDRILVVADNCTDDTAEVAIRAGAAVCCRRDNTMMGKAYALDFGRKALRAAPPAIVIVLDADCIPEPGALVTLAAPAHARNAAVQGRYLLTPTSDPLVRVSSFAFFIKNDVRQRGLERLGGVALLQGTGMALPWPMFDAAPIANSSLVEDLQLGLDLALAGHSVRFEPNAGFASRAGSRAATRSQRTRWEHGSLANMTAYVPKLAIAAVTQRRIALLVLAADLLVPPLALLVGASATVLAALILFSSAPGPMMLLVAGFALFAIALVRAWHSGGCALLPLSAFIALPRYLLWKLPIYGRLLVARERRWIRTSRT